MKKWLYLESEEFIFSSDSTLKGLNSVEYGIFYHAFNVLMDIISITRESVHIISKKEYSNLGSENTSNTLYN